MGTRNRATVLIVEDERELADAYARWLRESHTVHVAYTGEEALDMLTDDIDVVLLDRRLPGIAGRDVLRAINETISECRVALITAVDPDFDILGMEFDDYLVKPVLKADLEHVVDRLVTLQTYDTQFRESFSLANKRRVLEREKPRSALEQSAEYRDVLARLDELRDALDLTLADFENGDFERLYRELDRQRPSPEGSE